MTIWASQDFTGAASGTVMTTALVSPFTVNSGTSLWFGPQVESVPGQSAEVRSVSGSLNLSLGGRTNVRIGMYVKRQAGNPATTGLPAILWRSGATNRGDAFLRNSAGGVWALRGDTAGATNYNGQDTRIMALGETFYIEMEWTSGVGFELDVWYPDNASGTPNQHYTSAMTHAVDNVNLLNPSGSVTVTYRFAGLKLSDGEQIRVADPASVLNYNIVGDPRSDGFTVACGTANTDSVRLAVSTSSDLSSPTYFGPVTPDANGYAKLVATGLSPNVRYHWGVEHDGTQNTSIKGQCLTTPAPGTQASYKFITGSCHDYNLSSMFANLRTHALAQNSLFLVHLGDLGYPWITASGTPIAPSDQALLRAAREEYLAVEEPMALYRSIPISYTYSDGDGAGANSDGTWPAFVSGDVQAAYRTQIPNPTLPLADTQARSWVIGRERHIQTDELTMASARGATDNSAKTKLGAAQKAWFKDELQAAKDANEVVFWYGDGPWVGSPSVGGTLQEWRAYNTERVELGNYIQTLGVKIIRIHGDTHSLAADSGANNAYGGFPFISAAPLGTTAHTFGPSVDHGFYPPVTTNGARQFGDYTVTDTGDAISLDFAGYSWDGSAYVERVSMVTTWDMSSPTQMWTSVSFEGNFATEAWFNGQLIWSA